MDINGHYWRTGRHQSGLIGFLDISGICFKNEYNSMHKTNTERANKLKVTSPRVCAAACLAALRCCLLSRFALLLA